MPFSPALPMPFALESALSRPSCPWCGEAAIASEHTSYSSSGRARHSWRCDGCEQTFQTVVTFK
jgi:transposase-like protein